MEGMAGWLLAYASGHVLLSLVIAPVLYLVTRTSVIAPEKRAALLLVALVILVVGPAPSVRSEGADGAGQTYAQGSHWSDLSELPPATDSVRTMLPAPGPGDGQPSIEVHPALAGVLVVSWLAGVAWALMRLLVARAGLLRIVTASRRSRELEQVHRNLIPAGVQILVSPSFGPAAIGILRPKIVLPQGMTRALPADALRAVLLHESTHHRRRDVHVLLVQRLVEAVFWWNPVVRLLATASDAAREVACDIGAARAYGGSTDYAEALLDSITYFVPAASHADAWALHAAASLSTLEERIDAIIEGPHPRGWQSKAMLPGMGGALMLLCVGASIAAPNVAVQRAVDPMPPVAMGEADPVPLDGDALLALYDRHSQFVHQSHDRQSQTVHELTESYTRELTALVEQPPHDGKDASLARLNERYDRLFATSEIRFRLETAQAEEMLLHARQALDDS